MDEQAFKLLVAKLENRLQKSSIRESISVEERITLHFFASGTPYRRIAMSYRIAHNTLSKMVRETASTSKDAKDGTNSLYDDDDLFEAASKLLPNDFPPDTSSETAKVETDSLYDGDEQFEAAFRDIL